MTPDSIIFSISFTGFVVFFISFALFNRKWVNYPIYTMFSSFVLGLIISIFASIAFTTLWSFVLLAFFLYSLLVAVYIFGIYLNIDSSIHVKIFQEVAKMGTKGLTYPKLLRNYNRQVIMGRRLAWLYNSGEIGKTGKTYFIRRHHSLLIFRENFLRLLGKLYGQEEGFNLLLLCILLGAFLVRFWGIGFGLPDVHFGDEQYQTYWAFYSGSHSLRPPYYLNAPFLPMLLLIEFSIYYAGGFLSGVFSSPEQFFVSYLSNLTPFFLIGRMTMVMVGVITVWFVYVLGKTFFNSRTGSLAAFFLAFAFLHVKESHYIKPDVTMGFFVLGAFYFVLHILQKERMRDYIWCGILFAFALGTKYQAILLLPIIYLAHIVRSRKVISKGIVLFGICSFLTFCFIHPYFILEPRYAFFKTFSDVSGTKVVYPEHLLGKPVWWWFLFEHVPQGIGYPLFITSIVGFVLCAFQAKAQKKYFFILLLPMLFFVTIDSFTAMHFARYAIILLPFFVLSAAICLDWLANKLRLNTLLLSFIAIILIFPSLLRIMQFNTLLTKSDTRKLAKQWFERVVPRGAKVLVESTVKPEIPSSFNASLALDTESVDKRIADAESIGQDAQYLRALKEANQNKIGYDIVATTQVGAISDMFTDQLTRIKNVNYYVENNVGYIALTSWVQEKMSPEFEASLNEHYSLIQEFRPTYAFKNDPHIEKVDFDMLDQVDIMRRDIVFGPVIRIYQLKP